MLDSHRERRPNAVPAEPVIWTEGCAAWLPLVGLLPTPAGPTPHQLTAAVVILHRKCSCAPWLTCSLLADTATKEMICRWWVLFF